MVQAKRRGRKGGIIIIVYYLLWLVLGDSKAFGGERERVDECTQRWMKSV